jgi:hypothetical protein
MFWEYVCKAYQNVFTFATYKFLVFFFFKVPEKKKGKNACRRFYLLRIPKKRIRHFVCAKINYRRLVCNKSVHQIYSFFFFAQKYDFLKVFLAF